MRRVEGYIYGEFCMGRLYAMEELTVLAPSVPGKILAVGKNYVDHIRELSQGEADLPAIPIIS